LGRITVSPGLMNKLTGLTIPIDQAGLLVLIAQIEPDHELDVLNIQDFHQFFITELSMPAPKDGSPNSS